MRTICIQLAALSVVLIFATANAQYLGSGRYIPPLLGGPTTRQSPVEMTREVEDVASRLTWLSPGDILYERRFRLSEGVPDATRNFQLLDRLFLNHYDPANLLSLLKHNDPKVRTLGIALLYQNGHLSDMEALRPLLDDEASTFPSPLPGPSLASASLPNPWPMQQHMVRDLAWGVIEFYTRDSPQAVGIYISGLTGPGGGGEESISQARRNWDEFFALRKGRSLSTIDFIVGLRRATSGSTPIPGERDRRVRQVSDRLYREIPLPDRFYIALRLNEIQRNPPLVESNLLLDFARQVPRQQRLTAISGGKPIDDPDVSDYKAGLYFLANARQLLLEPDADWLLNVAEKERARTSGDPSWPKGLVIPEIYIAAAQLAPSRAEEILGSAMVLYQQPSSTFGEKRCQIAQAQFDLLGQRAFANLVEWFFNDSSEGNTNPGRRAQFLAHARDSDPLAFRGMVGMLVNDRRLDQLGPQSMRIIVESVSGWLGELLATEEQIRESYGIDEYQRDRKFDALSLWRDKLRQTLPRWSKTEPTTRP